MLFRLADLNDEERLTAFYRHAVNNTPDMNTYARWVYGQHPTDQMIRDYIRQGAMYLLEMDGQIAAAMAVTMSQGDDYRDVDWLEAAQDDAVAVLHILCVDPAYQRQGLGSHMISKFLRLAAAAGKRSARLDALESNKPAHALYASFGFIQRGRKTMYADNTGWTDFLFFEHPLHYSH